MEDSLLVPPSVEQGNVPLETVEEEPKEPVVPAEEPKEPVQPTEPQLYQLPDGKMVDGNTLAKEWKDNFLPEFTRRSQELADIKKANTQPNEKIEDPYLRQDYVPQNYAEVIEEAKKRALQEIRAEKQAEIAQQSAVESEINSQLSELKKIDPSLNENSLFLHANEYRQKYGVSFPDLKSAYVHMKDMAELAKNVQQVTVKNIAKRSDPVSANQGRASGTMPNPNHYASAQDYLQAIKGSS